YQNISQKHEPSRKVFANCVRAFLVGGGICVIGQAIQEAFMAGMHISAKEAAPPTSSMMILLAVILTCIGVYDKVAQWAGAGTAVPITGFANSM
ncbi:SpoVA/SpoVAEb family sporulation membrane protein, partial [Bacillus cereus]|nr:SpoVA/SpoVAEb family sporulation membrane protein [Bacillus cereus]